MKRMSSYAARLLKTALDSAPPESSPAETAGLALNCHNLSMRCQPKRRRPKTNDDLRLEAALQAARIGRLFDDVTSREEWQTLQKQAIHDGLIPTQVDTNTSLGFPIDQMKLPIDFNNLTPDREEAVELNECLAQHLGIARGRECGDILKSSRRKPKRPPAVKTWLEKYVIMAKKLLGLLERVADPIVTLYCQQIIVNGLVANRIERRPPMALPSGKKQRLNENK